ncbi:hypothetical protein ACWOFR_03505 [Carnobacterium gallinarum]|uniref:hypothetical protein n=1 Tax=Carnobacterium gallinarum TaxID=2749 RepID=UPI0005588DCA|nr:hypothetical protein [Carnobacterium gallinarum]
MKKLFDETFTHEDGASRTIWYGYLQDELNEIVLDELTEIVKSDLKEETADNTITSWIFYFEAKNEDAIGDSVRQSIMIREKEQAYSVNVNMSDFGFVTKFDELSKVKELLEFKLN